MKIKDETHIKGLCLGGFGMGALTCDVDVMDGKIVRTRPMRFDKSYSPEDYKPWTIKARGSEFKASEKTDIPPFSYVYKKRASSRNRIPYPMKRVDWNPDGERNSQNRGLSKFERISWDEATEIIASEIRRIHEEYGPMAVLAQGDGHGETKVIHASHSCQMGLLALMGGFTLQARNPDSWEGWYWGAKHVWGGDSHGQGIIGNLLMDIPQNSDMVLHWGCDLETTPWGWNSQINSKWSFWLSDLGIKQFFISPDLNYAGAVHCDRWIPILPNTDSALQLAIAYVWMTEGTYEREYVDTHCVGFDWEEYYILGREDGIPKTPEWASKICGVPSRTIKALARKWAKNNVSILHCNGGSLIRSTYSTEPGRLEVLLMAMQGLGMPGRNVLKLIEWGLYGDPNMCPNPRSTKYMVPAAAYQGFNWNKPDVYDIRWRHIPKTRVPDAILGHYTLDNPMKWYGVGIAGWPRVDQFNEYQYPNIVSGEQIHMIWSDCPCWTTCWNGGNRFVEALRDDSIEFVLIQHPWFENDCHLADILLPISTKFEQRDIAVDTQSGYYNMMYVEPRCIEPVGEAKSDWEAVCEVAKKLGLLEEYTKGKTEEDWIRTGFDGSGIGEDISFEDFMEKGYWIAPTTDDWEDGPRGFEQFCKDPDSSPLQTPTGKIEIYSATLAEAFPNDDERPPYPKFKNIGRHTESLQHPRAEQYPFLLVSNHPRWRVHANMDDISWMREIQTCKVKGPDGYMYEPIWVNPIDAERHGLTHGDIAALFNERGRVLGGIYVTPRIMPGVVYQDHGARVDPIIPGKFDRGGANNLIAPGEVASVNTSAEVTSGFLVGLEKVDVFALAEQYPEVFSRAYHADEGTDIENWIA